MSDFQLVHGDMRDALQAMAKESIDAVVCDPPYELGFMGKKWDSSGVAFNPDTWAECYRVLKPGGRLLAFGGSRTAHRIWCAIEDAGFTIEDRIMWLYGSGFPKHRSKLKPGYEPICVARKGKVSDLNIDECRIQFASEADERESKDKNQHAAFGSAPRNNRIYGEDKREHVDYNPPGRWPANVALDEDAGAELDEQSGIIGAAAQRIAKRPRNKGIFNSSPGDGVVAIDNYGDIGGASRFFYCAKADRSEREHGLEGAAKQRGGSNEAGFVADREAGLDRNRPVANHHPTVKPVDLMRWLVRLVTLPGQTVLDPFTGSGTTGVACIQEGRNFVGVELSEEYIEIARRRIGSAPLNLFGVA